MRAELLRYSSASGILERIPEAMQAHHRVNEDESVFVQREDVPMVAIGRRTRTYDAHSSLKAAFEEDTESVDLSAFGF